MALTFISDDTMVITIPLLNNAQEGEMMPEKFHCVFKDAYKVFLKGQPKALGTAQIVIGLLNISLGLLLFQHSYTTAVFTLPSILFIVAGLLSYAAGTSPNMCLAKASFVMNLFSLFWATAAFVFFISTVTNIQHIVHCQNSLEIDCENLHKPITGIEAVTAVLLILELVISLVLLHWESKAVCRQHFNVLPMINLKQEV
ncbi:membrane-spanning 4-domains subfamily A member 4D [Amia ocellicauda]|uniref:membrane-spanning 4-domains subfamily A member 4D n=1 Tax=Amia ocellicauda TaxID=2972642 RepID=UPI0034641417